MTLDRKHLESLLKINGVGSTSPDEQIRSVLLSARFNDDEVETALMILRENTKTSETRVDGLHKVFRSDQSLHPAEISKLLGIDVKVDKKIIVSERKKQFSLPEFVILWLASVILAVTCILFYMYSQNIGVFHSTGGMNFVLNE